MCTAAAACEWAASDLQGITMLLLSYHERSLQVRSSDRQELGSRRIKDAPGAWLQDLCGS